MPDSPGSLLIAILAAGASRRLGQPKQLVTYEGKPLIRRQCEIAVESDMGSVAVILGCEADVCRAAVSELPISIHVNAQWSDGLGSSIACAARAAQAAAVAGLLLLHCDQYAISANDLRALQSAWKLNPTRAVRSRAGSDVGPPVIFPRSTFADLSHLTGDDGAKSVIAKLRRENVVEVKMPSAAHDLDTPDQLRDLQ